MKKNPMRAQSMKKTYTGNIPRECPNNEGVECAPNNCRCEACGWNPKVAWERLRKMGIYPSSGALPVTGKRVGELAYVKRGLSIYTYQWSDNGWIPVTHANS